MIREYPIKKPTSAPGTGSLLYGHLMENIIVPARANHDIWYAGQQAQLGYPEKYPFRGAIPKGRTIALLSISNKPLAESEKTVRVPNREFYNHTFDGSEDPVLVSDLSDEAKRELSIPDSARGKDKVFNPNFVPYEALDRLTRFSNELASMSVPKSFSAFFGGKGRINYSEVDVLDFLETCFKNLSSEELMFVLSGNHMAWAVLAYIRSEGNAAGDVSAEFYRANPPDFYQKDLATVLPAMFYALSQLGQDPVRFHDMLDVDVWGAKDAAIYFKQFMPK